MIARRAVLAGVLAATPAAAFAQAPQAPARFAETTRYWAERGGRAMIVRRHGVTLAEAYAGGARADLPEPLGAATRLYATLAAAALVRDRVLDLGEPAAFTLGDWGADPAKAQVTVRDLLELSSGVAAGQRRLDSLFDALSLSPATVPGAAFQDDPAPFLIFAEIARRKLGALNESSLAGYLERRVLSRVAAAASFRLAVDGVMDLADGALASPRSLADIGELVRRRGVWRARQVVSAPALDAALTPSRANARYGIGFWLARGADRPWPSPPGLDIWANGADLPADLAVAAGAQGARLYVIPSRDLVAVRFGAADGWSDAQFLRLLLSGA